MLLVRRTSVPIEEKYLQRIVAVLILCAGTGLSIAAGGPATAGATAAAVRYKVYAGYADCPAAPSTCSGSVVTNPNYPNPWFGAPGVTFEADPTVVDPGKDGDPDTSAIRVDNTGTEPITIESLSVVCTNNTFDLWGTAPYAYPYTVAPGAKIVFSSTNGDNFDGSDICAAGPSVSIEVDGATKTYADDVANSGRGAIPGYPGYDESTPWTLIGGAKGKISGNPGKLPAGAVGTPYNQGIGAEDSNGAPTFVLSGGSLPPGLGLTAGPYPSEVTVSGTPTTPGSYAFVLGVSDSKGDAGSLTYTISIGATTTKLSASANPATVGQKVTFSAKVSPAPGGGTVEFLQDGVAVNDCSAVAPSATGLAKCKTSYAASGTYAMQAVYSGDADYAMSSSKVVTETVS